MSEQPGIREFGPAEQEADQGTIGVFLGIITGRIMAEPTAQYDPLTRGGCGWTIDPTEHDSLFMEFRVAGAGRDVPLIFDWLTKEEIPEAVAVYTRFREKHRLTDDPLSTHAEIEEIWIKQGTNGLELRRRVYDKEEPNYTELDKLLGIGGDNRLYNQQMDRFIERKAEQLARQAKVDAEEESLGLNRMTNGEVQEHIDVIQGSLQRDIEFGGAWEGDEE